MIHSCFIGVFIGDLLTFYRRFYLAECFVLFWFCFVLMYLGEVSSYFRATKYGPKQTGYL